MKLTKEQIKENDIKIENTYDYYIGMYTITID